MIIVWCAGNIVLLDTLFSCEYEVKVGDGGLQKWENDFHWSTLQAHEQNESGIANWKRYGVVRDFV